jgi:predicted O-linked N-acetylglucosamine transferase (SPINDLY family)
MQRVPESRLVLKSKAFACPEVVGKYQRLFAAYGITADRLTCMGMTPSVNSHLVLYNEMDIALDCFPYAGTTTTCEAMFMGVPVVTLASGGRRPHRHHSSVPGSLVAGSDSAAAAVAEAAAAGANDVKMCMDDGKQSKSAAGAGAPLALAQDERDYPAADSQPATTPVPINIHAHNVGVTLLSCIPEVHSLITYTEQEYIDVAVRLAESAMNDHENDSQLQQQPGAAPLSCGYLRRRLRAAMLASPLCDGKRYTRALHGLFEDIVKEYEESQNGD